MGRKPPLKLAILAPLVTPIIAPFAGGAQVMLHDLALSLGERGHSVSLFASRGSRLPSGSRVKLEEVPVDSGELKLADFTLSKKGSKPEKLDTPFFRQAELFLELFLKINRSNEFDLIHSHAFDWPAYAFSPLSCLPTVHTVHLPAVDGPINQILKTAYLAEGRSNCVTVSKACAATYKSFIEFDRIIYNGVDIKKIPFGISGDGFLVFAGRMSPEKGADLAIDIAVKAGLKLFLVGSIYDRDYFDQKIKPRLDRFSNIKYLGQLDQPELWKLMSRAKGVLFSSRWEEPFGLVIAEAMSAGAPVIAFNRGASPEIIVKDKTGFLIEPDNIEEAADAVAKLGEIDRRACREHISSHFSLEKMVELYEDYYYSRLEI